MRRQLNKGAHSTMASASRSPLKGTTMTIVKHCQAAVEEALGRVKVETAEGIETVQLENGGKDVGVLVLPPDESNVHTVYALLVGLSGPNDVFAEGEYLVKLTLPAASPNGKGYPYEPPDFTFLTPNGVFVANASTPCISIGRFHKDETSGLQGYSAGMKLKGFVDAIWGCFADPRSLGGGININLEGEEAWKRAAMQSREYNRKNHAALIAQFDELYKLEERHKYMQEKVKAMAESPAAAMAPPPAAKKKGKK